MGSQFGTKSGKSGSCVLFQANQEACEFELSLVWLAAEPNLRQSSSVMARSVIICQSSLSSKSKQVSL